MLRKWGTQGLVQTLIAKIEAKFGFPSIVKLHSPRNFFPTCAGQLLYGGEFREKLGRRAPGSTMPDRYDRAECATELRVRAEIIEKIQRGRRPTKPFEIPDSWECKRKTKTAERKKTRVPIPKHLKHPKRRRPRWSRTFTITSK